MYTRLTSFSTPCFGALATTVSPTPLEVANFKAKRFGYIDQQTSVNGAAFLSTVCDQNVCINSAVHPLKVFVDGDELPPQEARIYQSAYSAAAKLGLVALEDIKGQADIQGIIITDAGKAAIGK